MSANPELGEVDVVVAGETYTLKLCMKAAKQLQVRNKKTIGELFAAAGRLDYAAIGELMFGLLQYHHGNQFGTPELVDALIDKAGGPKVFFQYAKAIEEIESESLKEVAAGNPPKAQAGTGVDSNSMLVGSV